MNREKFLKLMGFAYGSLALPGFSLTSCSSDSEEPGFFDLHAHPGRFFMQGTPDDPGGGAFSTTTSNMQSIGLRGAFFSCVADLPLLKVTENGILPAREFVPGEGWKEFKRQLRILKDLLNKADIEVITDFANYHSGTEHKRTSALLACEGGDFIEGLDLLDEAYENGLRSVQLMHYAPNHLGDLQTAPGKHNGLSTMGKAVVKKMTEIGMVIDVAHASEKTVEDVVDNVSGPIMLSHSILKVEADRPIAARAISPEHARLVASTGGVIGAWPSGFNLSLDDFVENILRLVDVVGIDHVGLGTDMDANFKPVIDRYTELPTLHRALLDRGLSESAVQKIACGNAERILQQVLRS